MKALLVVFRSKAWRPFEYYPIKNHAILISPSRKRCNANDTVIVYRFNGRIQYRLKRKMKSFPVGMTGNIAGSFPETVDPNRYKKVRDITLPARFARHAIKMAQACHAKKSTIVDFAKLLPT